MTDEPPPEFIEVTRTKIVEAPTPDPVVVSVVPDSCIEALRYADTISRAADNLYSEGVAQLDIISDARKALAEGGDLNTLENRQRALQGDTVDDLYTVSEAITRFTDVHIECKKESK